MGNVGPKSTKSGLALHLQQNGIETKSLRLFPIHRGKLSAKIVIPFNQIPDLESDYFPWPEGVYVRRWMGQTKLEGRYNKNDKNNNRYHDGNKWVYPTDSNPKEYQYNELVT